MQQFNKSQQKHRKCDTDLLFNTELFNKISQNQPKSLVRQWINKIECTMNTDDALVR